MDNNRFLSYVCIIRTVFGLAAATIGTLMLLTRLLDGVSDLIMGSIIDRTHTRWGKARPWILWTAIPMGLGLVLMFSVPDALSDSGKFVYASITYVVMAVVVYTACNLSYNTLLSLEAPDPKDRVTMSSIRFFVTMSVVLFINYNCNNFVEKFGWTGMSVIFGVIGAAFLLITFWGTKERVNIEKNSAKENDKDQRNVKESFKILFQNKYFFVTDDCICHQLYSAWCEQWTSYLLCKRCIRKCRSDGNFDFMFYFTKVDRKPDLPLY